jgi:hypothetical protein
MIPLLQRSWIAKEIKMKEEFNAMVEEQGILGNIE